MNSIVEEWNTKIDSWMIKDKQVAVAGLAHIKDGAVFAAASLDGDPAEQIYKAPYEVPIPQEDGTDLPTKIDEPEILKMAATTLRAPNGLWIGGQKYKIVRTENPYDQGIHKFKVLFCAKLKGGCYIIVLPKGCIVVAIYSEDLGQSGLSAKNRALAFGEYLADHGY